MFISGGFVPPSAIDKLIAIFIILIVIPSPFIYAGYNAIPEIISLF